MSLTNHAAQIPGPQALALQDELEPRARLLAISQEARAMRESFGRARADYNARVCDMLAAEGLAPTGSLVLKVGGWGTASDVQADVRAWYTGLSKSKADQELRIPAAARRRGLDLIEQLFDLANKTSDQRLQEQLAPTQEKLQEALSQAEALDAHLTQARLEAKEQADKSALMVEQLRADLEHSRAALATATDQIKELQSHAQQRAKEIEALKTACANMERQLERESFAHRDALSQAQAQAAQELLAARALADRDRQALALKIDQERQQQSAALRSAMSELAASGQRCDALTEKLAQVQADHARAQAQAQSLQGKVEQLQSSDRRLHVLAEALGCLGAAGLSLTVARGDRKKSPDTFKKVCEALGHWAPEALPGGIEILARQLVQPTAALPPDRPA